MSDTKTPAPVHPLLEGTTPGPWKVVTAWDDYMVEGPNGEEIIWQSGSHDTPTISKANANLIAMAPTLAADNARLRAALERIEKLPHTIPGTTPKKCGGCIAREVLASLTT